MMKSSGFCPKHKGESGTTSNFNPNDSETSNICGKVWSSGYQYHRCFTCAKDPGMALCQECFSNGVHENHETQSFTSPHGGFCDCGLSALMEPHGFCNQHRSSARSEAPADEALAHELSPADADEEMEQLNAALALSLSLVSEEPQAVRPEGGTSLKECKICFERRLLVVFVPCRHALACQECGDNLQRCPVCREGIELKFLEPIFS